MITYSLGFAAGALSLLAPCVLPIIPIVVASSSKTSKWGPLANALGLALSFTVFGILTSLFSNLFDFDLVQRIGAVILFMIGMCFIFPSLKKRLVKLMQCLSTCPVE